MSPVPGPEPFRIVGSAEAPVRNKVLPAMLLGAGVAMGVTQVLGLTPATAFGSDGPGADETGSAADTSLTPGPVAVVNPIPRPAPAAAPVVAPTPARSAGARPAAPRTGDEPARIPQRATPTVAPQRVSGVPPQRPGAPGGSGDEGGGGGALSRVVGTAEDVASNVPEVVDRVPEVLNETVSGAGEVVDGLGSGLGLGRGRN